ncbi:hypothetical protein DVH05_005122 [Phytophthora capsici]|nr:hypothetical protein DVH05_005122 [Phytophthora capsici]
MKLCYIFVILAAFFMAIGEASITDEKRQNQRFLRTAGYPDHGTAAEEERGAVATIAAALAKLQSKAKIPVTKNTQFKLWHAAKWDYNKLMSHFGFAAKDKALYENNPIYHLIVEYSAKYLRQHTYHGIFI